MQDPRPSLIEREHTLTGDMGIQLDRAIALGGHQVGETATTTMRAASGVDDASVVVGSMLALGRLLCCYHPQDNAGKIGLTFNSPLNQPADTEAVTQTV
jgi:hypothetical protein